MIFRVTLSQKFLFGWGLSAVVGLVLVGVMFSLALNRYHQSNANIVLEKSFRIVKAQLKLRAELLDTMAINLARDQDVVNIVRVLNPPFKKQKGKQNIPSRRLDAEKRKLVQHLAMQGLFSDDYFMAIFGREQKLLASFQSRRFTFSPSKGTSRGPLALPEIANALVPPVISATPKHTYSIFSNLLFYTSTVPVVWRGSNDRNVNIGTLVLAYGLDAPFAAHMSQLLDEPFSIRVGSRAGRGALSGLSIDNKKPLPDLFSESDAFQTIPDKRFFVGAAQIRTSNIGTSNIERAAQRILVLIGVDKQVFVSGSGELRKSLLMTLAVIALVILPFGAYFVWRNLTRPIAQLMSGIEALPHREPDDMLTLESRDELGMLAQSLSVMAQTIKAREHDLESSRDQLRLITDNLPFLIAYVDTQRTYRFVNRTCAQWCAQPLAAMIGVHANNVFGEEYQKISSHIDEVLNGQSVTYENTIDFPDGVTRRVRISYIAHRGEEETVEGFFVIAADITDIRHAEEQLRHAQKMESVGQLTGGIAHDFNNILSIVMGNLELLQRMDIESDKAQERLESALRGVRRGADLTSKLLGFSSRNLWGVEIISVNRAIENIHSLITKSLTVAINIEMHLADDLWLVEIDPGDFEDIILNLALNARDAMPAGGLLVIETQNKTLDDNYVRRNPEGHMGEHILISLSDTGTGMVADVCERIFEPFFTTKGEGTGLGLSMVYGSVQRAGGQIKVYSEPGDGTMFRIYLPRAVNALKGGQDIKSVPKLPRGTQSILIVDDEEDLLDTALTHIESLGYRAYTALNAKQALKIISENPSIDLLFSDVVMPGGEDGYQLAQAALKIRPTLKILITSGFTQKREESIRGDREMTMKLAGTLLNKPYGIAELAVAIRRTLDSAP